MQRGRLCEGGGGVPFLAASSVRSSERSRALGTEMAAMSNRLTKFVNRPDRLFLVQVGCADCFSSASISAIMKFCRTVGTSKTSTCAQARLGAGGREYFPAHFGSFEKAVSDTAPIAAHPPRSPRS
jgi:hypothetical protein